MSKHPVNFLPSPRTSAHSHLLRKARLIPEIIRDQIRLYVTENDLALASALLAELSEIYAPKRFNEVTILQRGVADIENNARMNILEFELISRERNRLGLAILNLVDAICAH